MTTAPVVTITDELLAEIEAAADAATPGPWCVDFSDASLYICEDGVDDKAIAVMLAYDDSKEIPGCYEAGEKTNANLHHIARANPATIKALLVHIADLKRDSARLNWLAADSALILECGGLYRLQWPDTEEVQTEWFKSARGAIDAAMEANP